MTRRRFVHWLLWGALAIHASIALVAVVRSPQHDSDLDNFYDIGTKAGRPYVDFPVEFPVGTIEAFRTIAPVAASRERFGVTIVLLNFAANLTIVASLAWAWGIEAAACYMLVVAPILDLYLLRLDLWSTALATFGVAAWRRDRRSTAAIAFVTGAAFKLWPLGFLPLLLVPSRGRVRVAPVATAIVSGVALLCGWLWVAGARGLYQVLTFRGARGWEVESTVGSVWMLIGRSSLRLENGAWRIGTMVGPTSVVLFALGAAPCLWMIWRGARTGHLGTGWTGGLSALLVCSALLSPQFTCWFAPAAGVAWAEGDSVVVVLSAIAVFLTNLEFKAFSVLLRGAPRIMWLLVFRNLWLVVLAVAAGRLIARAPLGRSDSPQSPAPPPAQSI